jgi:hypothetical protein
MFFFFIYKLNFKFRLCGRVIVDIIIYIKKLTNFYRWFLYNFLSSGQTLLFNFLPYKNNDENFKLKIPLMHGETKKTNYVR